MNELELIMRLEDTDWKDTDALNRLGAYYVQWGEYDMAVDIFERLLLLAVDDDERANRFYSLGTVMEKKGEFQQATGFYRKCLAGKPRDAAVRYFANNNLGFSLNKLGRFHEAETYLEQAIMIAPGMSNAYKNLGICCQGLGRLGQAARLFIEATKANPRDGRSVELLETLLAERPEMLEREPGLKDDLESCRKVVAAVEKNKPVVH